jgi:hypothetical protein
MGAFLPLWTPKTQKIGCPRKRGNFSTRDEGWTFEFGNQVLISSHRKLLSSKAMVVSVAEKSGHDPVRHG